MAHFKHQRDHNCIYIFLVQKYIWAGDMQAEIVKYSETERKQNQKNEKYRALSPEHLVLNSLYLQEE